MPLERAGLALLSTLDWRDQEAAEAAVRDGLARVERRSPRRAAPLEAALVSVDPRDGAVLAYVGGRDWTTSQFDRVADARRQAGSAFKPIVYATAFALGVAAPASILEDEPLAVTAGGDVWQPRDDDGEFRGPLPARAALETSRNLPPHGSGSTPASTRSSPRRARWASPPRSSRCPRSRSVPSR